VNKTCDFCGACVATIAASFADFFECGTTWSKIDGWERSMRCREAAKGDE
jgi:hypothetical protein